MQQLQVTFFLLLALLVQSATQNKAHVSGTNLTLYWTFYDDTHIDVRIEWSQPKFIALVLGDTTTNSDMWLCSLGKNMENWTVSDQWSTLYEDAHNDISVSGSDDLTNKEVELANGIMTCKFRRKLSTGDSKDKVIAIGEKIRVCSFQSTTTYMKKHSTKSFCFYWLVIDNFNGQLSTQPSSKDTWALVHGLVMTVGWGVLVDFGIMAARYFRTLRYYTLAHAVTFFLIDITTVPMAIFMIVLNRENIFHSFNTMQLSVKLHFIIGLVLIVLIFVQHMMGGIVKHKQQKVTSPAQKFLQLRKIHIFTGYSVYVLTKVQLGIGWWVYGGSFSIFVGLLLGWYCILALLRLWLEHSFKKHKSFFTRHFKRVNNQLVESLIEQHEQSDFVCMINENKSRQEIVIAHPSMKYVHFKDHVCDIEGFNHPGGNSLMQSVYGRDVSKYIYGAAHVEGNYTRLYTHSLYTIDYLYSRIICTKPNIVQLGNQGWSLREQIEISPELFRFIFENPALKMPTNPKNPASYLGKFWLITTDSGTRPYTLMLCMLDQNIRLRSRLIEFYKDKFMNGTVSKEQELTSQLPLIIKRYIRGTVSKQIRNGVRSIEGIYGEGLQIYRGLNIIIVGGTGILPFLDLFDLLLKKAIATVAYDNGVDSRACDPYDIGYIDVLPKTRVRLYASFTTIQQFYNYSWLVELHRISSQHKLDLFELFVKVPQTQPLTDVNRFLSHIDEGFFQLNLQVLETSKILVCGPPTMNEQLYRIILPLSRLQGKMAIF